MRIKFHLLTGLCALLTVQAIAQWNKPDKKGNSIPDFSRVGYEQGLTSIPMIPAIRTIEPSNGDATSRIQVVLDEMGKLPISGSGFRGALLLKKGRYEIRGTLYIRASGIILRGEGDSTVLVATGKGKRDLIRVSGEGNRTEIPGTRKKITSSFVPVGAKTISISDTKGLKVGDAIVLFRPGTAAWIHDLKMDRIDTVANTKQWQPKEYDLFFERRITAINGNRISMDNPVMMELEEKYGGGEIFGYTANGRIHHIGIEQLRCESDYTGEEDEDHGWVAVSMNRVENAWVSNLTALHFGYSCVHLGDQTKQITVRNSRSLAPKSKITGSRRYSFNNDGQLNLFINCFASEGRHDFVTGARTCGPNVFYNCKAEKAQNDIGPHHRWSVGTLYDHIETDGAINIQDRGNWGTGHGWAGVTQIVWNSRTKTATVQSPWVSGKNYAIGLEAEKTGGRLKARPDGEWIYPTDWTEYPSSLYISQLAATRIATAGKLESEVIARLRPGILQAAQQAMQEKIQTITAFPASRSAGGIHDFYSEGDYWWPDPRSMDSPYIRKDGLSNPDNFTAHREVLIRFSQLAGTLASAYRLTGDKKYADKLLDHCRAWFLDPATRMNPSLLYAQAIKGRVTGRGIGIIDTIHFMEVVMGLLAIEEAMGDKQAAFTGIRQWFDEYLHWLTTHPYGKEERDAKNNHGTCWTMQVAVFAKFTGNHSLMEYCRNRFKTVLLPDQMALNGSFPLELNRTKPYGYSIFNLDAMAVLTQTLSTPMESLWQYEEAGKSMQKGIQFLYPFIQNKNTWPYAKDVMYWESWPVAAPFLVLGGMVFDKQEWINTWKKLEHTPIEPEIIRNLPVRNPLLWF